MSATGPVYVSTAMPILRFNAEGSPSLALWDKDTRTLSVAFYAARPSAAERKEIRSKKDLRAVAEAQPQFMITFELLEGFSELRRESLRSYGVHFIRSTINNGAGFYFPGESDIVSFYEIVSSEPSAALQNVGGHLYEAESVKAVLENSATKELEGRTAKFEWHVKVDAPIIDALSEPVSSTVFDPEFAKIDRSVPDASSGTIEAGKATARLVDAVALFYPAEANLVIGFYASPLSEKDKASIVANKGVWQSKGSSTPNLVLSIDLKKGGSALSRAVIENLRLTFVRDRLGDFYFPGSLDRATVTKKGSELDEVTLSHLSGMVEDGGSIALRLTGSHMSSKLALSFTWSLAVREEVIVVE